MSMRSEVALAIQDSIIIPDNIKDILSDYTPHKRHSTMNGHYTVYYNDDVKFFDTIEELQLKAWLQSLPYRQDDNDDDIECYQLVVYTQENDNDIEYYGYIWFEIILGLQF